MAPRLTEPHPRIESTRGCAAIERGPLVYCLEQADSASASLLDVALDPGAPLRETWRPDLLGGIVTVQASGEAVEVANWGRRRSGPGSRAWMPRAKPYR